MYRHPHTLTPTYTYTHHMYERVRGMPCPRNVQLSLPLEFCFVLFVVWILHDRDHIKTHPWQQYSHTKHQQHISHQSHSSNHNQQHAHQCIITSFIYFVIFLYICCFVFPMLVCLSLSLVYVHSPPPIACCFPLVALSSNHRCVCVRVCAYVCWCVNVPLSLFLIAMLHAILFSSPVVKCYMLWDGWEVESRWWHMLVRMAQHQHLLHPPEPLPLIPVMILTWNFSSFLSLLQSFWLLFPISAAGVCVGLVCVCVYV